MSLSPNSIASRWSSPVSSRSISCNRSGWSCGRSKRGARRSKIDTPASFRRADAPAPRAVSRVYALREFFEWRGLGSIDHSGVRLRVEYARFDAERKFAIPNLQIADPKSCQCGEALEGAMKPWQCKVFGSACTPEPPLGALMVSSEGACAACYQSGGVKHHEAAE